jgi:hypothetical protein
MLNKFKVLNTDMKSPFQDFQYKIGEWYECKDFDSNVNADCSNGFYATDIEGLPYSFNTNRLIFECEVKGKSVIYDIYKQRFEFIKIIRQYSFDEVKELARKKENELGYKLSEALFPINPLLIDAELNNSHKDLLKKWASVWASIWVSIRDSIRDSVKDSIWASVWASVWDSIRNSVKDSIWASVWASVWASIRNSVWDSIRDSIRDSVRSYISSLFPNIKKWKYIEHLEGVNPFQPCIDLWCAGFVPSYDGKIWRLHTGVDAKIVYEMKDI